MEGCRKVLREMWPGGPEYVAYALPEDKQEIWDRAIAAMPPATDAETEQAFADGFADLAEIGERRWHEAMQVYGVEWRWKKLRLARMKRLGVTFADIVAGRTTWRDLTGGKGPEH